MTRQKLARLKLKAYNAGKAAARSKQKPALPDGSYTEAELQECLNSLYAGYQSELNKLPSILDASK